MYTGRPLAWSALSSGCFHSRWVLVRQFYVIRSERIRKCSRYPSDHNRESRSQLEIGRQNHHSPRLRVMAIRVKDFREYVDVCEADWELGGEPFFPRYSSSSVHDGGG